MSTPLAPLITSILRQEREAKADVIAEMMAANDPKLPSSLPTYTAVVNRELSALIKLGLVERRGRWHYAIPPNQPASS
jgi:hypothetical protein